MDLHVETAWIRHCSSEVLKSIPLLARQPIPLQEESWVSREA